MISFRVPPTFMAGIVILSEDQTELVGLIHDNPGTAVLIRPIQIPQLSDKLLELMGAGQEAEA